MIPESEAQLVKLAITLFKKKKASVTLWFFCEKCESTREQKLKELVERLVEVS